MATPTPEPFLTIKQAAEILAVNMRMFRRVIETRRIALVQVDRRVPFRNHFLTAAIHDWTIEPRKRASTSGR
jgi:hypothetical protein